jgi:Ca-activated chloride channel family protein
MILYFQFLWIIIAIPLVVFLIFLWSAKKEKQVLSSLGNVETLVKLINKSPKLVKWKQTLFILALIFILLALLRPQWGLKKETIERKGLDLIIALDISSSMWAEDLQPNRLDKAIMEIRRLLPQLNGDRVGLVTFSGSATSICPLTLDYGAIEMFLEAIGSYQEARAGTNLAQAYQTAKSMFTLDTPEDKLILLFTDGENHEGNLDEIKSDSQSQGIIVIPVALGSSGGQPIPNIDNEGIRNGYKKDKKGNIVISHVDYESLKKIATIGPYIIDTNEQTIMSVLNDTTNYKRSKLKDLKVSIHKERYQYFLFVGLFLLLLSYSLKERA